MTSPSLKRALLPAPTPPAPTSPKARRALLPATRARAPTSARLRRALLGAYIAPKLTPRLRRPMVPVAYPPARLWTPPANWAEGLRERLTWSTDVSESEDGTEHRVGLRARPLRTLDYSFLLEAHDTHHAEALLHAHQGALVDLPVWTDSQRLTAAVAAGAGAIPLDTAGLDFAGGAQVALLPADYGAADYGVYDTPYELATVDEVQEDQLVLVDAVARAWTPGTRVVPVRSGRLPGQVSWDRPVAEGVRGSITVELDDPGWETLPELVADEYRGVHVLPFRPNRREDMPESYTRLLTRFEGSGGVVRVFPRRDRPGLTGGGRFTFEGRAQILQLRAWLERCAGRRKSFWAPSYQNDLQLALPTAAADQHVVVKSVRGTNLYGQAHGPTDGAYPYRRAGRSDIELRTGAGATPIRRRILSWARVGPGQEQLFLDAAVGADLVPARALVSWLSLRRLEADTVELQWITDRLLEVDLPTKVL